MSKLDIVDHASFIEVRNIPYYPCAQDQDLYCLDLYVPKHSPHVNKYYVQACVGETSISIQHNKLSERKQLVPEDVTRDSTPKQCQFLSPEQYICFNLTPPPMPPIVVFVHGGGWQRGGRQAWVQYAKTLNLLLSAITWFMGLYNNVGAALASRGVACAIISYPLTRLAMPWILFDIFISYWCSVVFSILVCSLLSVVSSLIRYTMHISWNEFTYHPTYLVLPTDSDCIFSFAPSVTTLLIFNNILTFTAMFTFTSWNPLCHISFILTTVLMCVSSVVLHHAFLNVDFPLTIYFVTLILGIGARLVSYSREHSFSYIHQLQAVSSAVRWVKCAKVAGCFDPQSLFLMGHSAGGHLVSLVTLDTHHLVQAGCSVDDIKGVVCISGVYNLLKLSAPITRYLYLHPTFGSLTLTWAQASPILALINGLDHTSYPPFLIMNAEYDGYLNGEAEEFLTHLQHRKIDVTKVVIPRTMHLTIMSSFSVSLNSTISAHCVEFILKHMGELHSRRLN